MSLKQISEATVVREILPEVDTYDKLAGYVYSLIEIDEVEDASEIVRATFLIDNLHQFEGHHILLHKFSSEILSLLVEGNLIGQRTLSVIQPVLWYLATAQGNINYSLAAKAFSQSLKSGIFAQLNSEIKMSLISFSPTTTPEQDRYQYSIRDFLVEMMLSGEQMISLAGVYGLINDLDEYLIGEKQVLLIQMCHALLDIVEEGLSQGLGLDHPQIQQLRIATLNILNTVFSGISSIVPGSIAQSADLLADALGRAYSLLGINIDLRRRLTESNQDGKNNEMIQYLMWKEIREYVLVINQSGLTFLFNTLYKNFEEMLRLNPEYIVRDREVLAVLWPWLDLIGATIPDFMKVSEMHERLLRYSKLLDKVDGALLRTNGTHPQTKRVAVET
ncbi:hypothetical protein KC640_00335 [Candidatus Dojkabacteria bacterium]|uniref:Uncharacterized protein n=1 Tax=Candidatus Dojkabacteria bacterium TaxID=2099670 RepID=A0A955ICL5_9BACT|nr:hypothetical protein [Candidatus Dojkabacteria bacterium]